jgi:hypothetical protein
MKIQGPPPVEVEELKDAMLQFITTHFDTLAA